MHRIRPLAAAVAAVCVVSTASVAPAGIVLTTGSVSATLPPASVVPNGNQSDTELRVFPETTQVLASPLAVDVTTHYSVYDPPAGGSPGTIPAGTTVNSYYVTLDPVSGSKRLKGSISFSEPILGVITSSDAALGGDHLAPSHVLGYPGTTYPGATPGLGMETNADNLRVYPSTVIIDLVANYVDHIRIITDATGPPIPTEIGMTGRKLLIKDRYREGLPFRRSMQFKSSGNEIVPVIADPAVTGAHLFIHSATMQYCLGLSAGSWSSTGSYGRTWTSPGSPCTKVIFAGNSLKLKCPTNPPGFPMHGYELVDALQGTVYVDFTAGPIRYCAVFDGADGTDIFAAPDPIENPDDRGVFLVGSEPAPVACPPVVSGCP